MAGMFDQNAMQQLMAQRMLQQPQAPQGMSPWEQMAFQGGAGVGNVLGMGMLNRQINAQQQAAQAQQQQQAQELVPIMAIQDPSAKFEKLADYWTSKGEFEKANQMIDAGQKAAQLGIRSDELKQTKAGQLATQAYHDKQLALESKRIDMMGKQYQDPGEKRAAGIRTLAEAEQKATEAGDTKLASLYRSAADDLAGVEKIKQLPPVTSKEIEGAVAELGASFQFGGQPITKLLSKGKKGGAPGQLEGYLQSVALAAERFLRGNPKLSKEQAIKDAHEALSIGIKAPDNTMGKFANILSSVSGGYFDPSKDYTFNLNRLSPETQKNLLGGDEGTKNPISDLGSPVATDPKGASVYLLNGKYVYEDGTEYGK